MYVNTNLLDHGVADTLVLVDATTGESGNISNRL
jgi:hypothetical protein